MDEENSMIESVLASEAMRALVEKALVADRILEVVRASGLLKVKKRRYRRKAQAKAAARKVTTRSARKAPKRANSETSAEG